MTAAYTTTPEFDYRAYRNELSEYERKYAPAQLYLRGRAELLVTRRRCSIVGSRKASVRGLATATALAEAMVRHGITVVSGLAAGIDTAAHHAAIAAGGDTVAVIGTPLAEAYPRENAELQEHIAREHLLVSQFDRPIGPKAFPIRNRTMALISDATFIVEAAEKSGTRHQGWEAIRVGREVYLHEVVCEALGWAWAGKMLEYGAVCFGDVDVDDVLEELIPRTPTLEPYGSLA